MSQHILATLVDTPAPGKLRIRLNHLVSVSAGRITAVEPYDPASSPTPTLTLPPTSFLLPTFTDLHLHAPQYLYAGTGLDLPLLEWLEKYAYRAEERIDGDDELARNVYRRLVERLVQAGTGCVVAFGTIGVAANVILAEAFQAAGLRGFIGKLSMDQSPRPTYGEADVAASLDSLHAFLDRMEALAPSVPAADRLVKPILTPRFVPTCSDALLRELAKVARQRGVWVQSHMCESRDQMEWVESTRGKRDEVVFDEAGLLGPTTVQAHVTSLPPGLVDLVKERGVTLAHCPLSNAYFSDAVFPCREVLDAGAKIGLGSDIAGGYALSIQASMRHAVVVARLREGARKEAAHAARASGAAAAAPSDAGNLRIDWVEALYLATKGGKSALGLGGAFDVGMEFDAQLIDLGAAASPLDLFDLDTATEAGTAEAVERWWCNGDDRNRAGMWVAGRRLR